MRNLLLGAVAGGLVESFNALTEVRRNYHLFAVSGIISCAGDFLDVVVPSDIACASRIIDSRF